MDYQHYDLGHRTKGETVEVAISRSADVKLMDHANLQKFRYGKEHRPYGGHYRVSPVLIGIQALATLERLMLLCGFSDWGVDAADGLSPATSRPYDTWREDK